MGTVMNVTLVGRQKRVVLMANGELRGCELGAVLSSTYCIVAAARTPDTLRCEQQ